MNLRPNWQVDCPKCVASKFTCDEHHRPADDLNAYTIEAECAACDGNGWKLTRNPNVLMRGCHEVPCQKCNATGWLECPNKGGVDCPHPQQCICEAAWERQEQQKMEDF